MTAGASPELAVLTARLRAARAGCADAPSAWAGWALRQLDGAPEAEGIGRNRAYDRVRSDAARERLGQVFTPPDLARALACFTRVERPGRVLDPAAGDGSLLLAVADCRKAHGHAPAAVLDSLVAWDIDPIAAWLCRIALVQWGLANAVGPAPGDLQVECRDALAAEPPDVRFVVSNPPYLEAKRMGRAQPGLRDRLRARYPELTGAFDLYLAFALSSLAWAPAVGLILPNKVCQGRYARRFRERVMEEGRLAGLVDLARVTPRPFPGTSVYPVLLHLERAERVRVARCLTPEDVREPAVAEVAPAELARVDGEQPWFVPFDTWPDLEPLLDLPRLGSAARIVTTCSFHAKGLREAFVTPQRPDSLAYPYLGGPSRSRQTELQPFEQRWAGWWIRYDQEALKSRHRNPLPPLSNFLRPKAIFNQHDRRMSAWADSEGRFVTKDVYPIAWPEAPGWTLEKLVGVLNSTVFTALYNTFFQGILVGGETYHYLPAFLSIVPVPPPAALDALDALVPRMQAERDPGVWLAIDRAVAAAYGVSEAARERMVDVHLTRVGAPAPGTP